MIAGVPSIVFGVFGLAKNLAFGHNGRVRRNHDGAFARRARLFGHGVRFGLRDAADVIFGGFLRQALAAFNQRPQRADFTGKRDRADRRR